MRRCFNSSESRTRFMIDSVLSWRQPKLCSATGFRSGLLGG